MPRVAAVHVQQVTPDGPITDAPAPVPVSFTLQWVLHERELGPVVSEVGWAVAWTSDAVLVCFRIGRQGMAVWLPARAVTRR